MEIVSSRLNECLSWSFCSSDLESNNQKVERVFEIRSIVLHWQMSKLFWFEQPMLIYILC